MIFNCCHKFSFRIKIPDVTEKLRRYAVGRTLSSNLVYTIWAVFGGFILHFLLSNYLTVLLRPNFEEPVDTAADILRLNITPVVQPNHNIYRQMFANSPDPIYQELSRRLVVAKTMGYYSKYSRAARRGHVYTVMFPRPQGHWDKGHYSKEYVKGRNHLSGSIANKKWPLKKVFKSSSMKQHE